MKKILFILLFSFVYITTNVQAENEDFGKVGVDKIQVTALSPTSVKINATFFNLSNTDVPVHVEASITDRYSEEVLANVDMLTSDILDKSLVIPKQNNIFTKEYTYTIPDISKKSSYKVELRLVDNHENTLYVRQSDLITLGSVVVASLANTETHSWFMYDGKKYDLQDGPSIEENKKDTAFYELEVSNKNNTPLTVYLDYSTRKYASETSQFSKNIDASTKVEIPKKSKKVIRIPAKYIHDGGTYEGKIDVSMEQDGKIYVFKTDEFRYMIGGSFIVVTDARMGTSTLSLFVTKSLFDSTAELTEEYLNSTSSNNLIKEYKDKEYTFSVDFLDASGTLVTSQHTKIVWGSIDPEIKIPVSLTDTERKNITQAKVTATDFTDMVLYTGTFDIANHTESVVHAYTIGQKTVAYIILMILIILALFGYGISRHKLWLVCLLICAALLSYITYSHTLANTAAITSGNFSMSSITDGANDLSGHCYDHGYRGLTMQAVNYPSPSDTFMCGQTTSVYLRPTNSLCGNNPSTTWFYPTKVVGANVVNSAGSIIRVGSHVTVYYRTAAGVVTAYPLKVRIDNGYTGTAYVYGYYRQENGACSSQTGTVKFTFRNITCSQDCHCSGRDNVCTSGAVTSTTTGATECQIGASCTTSLSGNQGTFTYLVTNALGTLSYKNTDTGAVITNPYTRTIAAGQTVTQKTTITDSYDNTTAFSVCSITNDGSSTGVSSSTTATTTSSSTTRSPKIVSFKSLVPVVTKGDDCTYDWDTEDMDRCSMVINNQTVSLVAPGLYGPVRSSTANGLNQRATITCVADPVGSSSAVTMATTTLCQVLPEVIER